METGVTVNMEVGIETTQVKGWALFHFSSDSDQKKEGVLLKLLQQYMHIHSILFQWPNVQIMIHRCSVK